MNESLTKKSLLSLAPLLLFAVFTACILMVLLSGADIYHKIAKRDQRSINQRTVSQYLTTRLHQSDAVDMISVGSFETPDQSASSSTPTEATADSLSQYRTTPAGDTLYLREELNGRIYYTRIYAHAGMLRELFAAEGLNFKPSHGTGILPLKDLHFTLQDGLLTIDITYEDGTSENLFIALRSGSSQEKEDEQ